MNKKSKLYLNAAFLFIFVGSLWFLTDNINNLSFQNHITNVTRNLFSMLRTIVYIILLVVSFVGLLKNKKMTKVYFITLIFLSFHTLVWIPEFFEYIVSLFTNMNYAMTKFFGFTFTIIGDIFFVLYKKENN